MKKNKKIKLDKILLIIMIMLLIFGLIMVLSASSMASYMRYHKSIYYFFIRHGIFMVIGLIAFFIAICLPTRFFKKISVFLMIVLTVALAGLTVYGSVYNSSKGWYDLGFMTVQPSEIGKIFIILYLAYYYEKHKDELDNYRVILMPIIWTVGATCLVIFQPDLGTALIILFIIISIFFSLPFKKNIRSRFVKIFAVCILFVVLLLIVGKGTILKDYQLQRFNFIDPCERYSEESGYQLCNSFIALKNGGLFGKGLGESTQKYLYLPEAHTDFIFPIIVEELGAVTGIAVVFIYLIMLVRILNIARNANNIGNAIIAYGVFAYILIHIIVNLMGALGMIPLTGVPLPFLSYGGSYMLTLLFSMGLVQRVYYETNRVK